VGAWQNQGSHKQPERYFGTAIQLIDIGSRIASESTSLIPVNLDQFVDNVLSPVVALTK
jgi:hypothetical protein